MIDENDDANVADKDEDIKPQAAKSKDAHTAGNGGGSKKTKSFDDDSDSDYEDEDDDDDDSELDQWSLRKCSAAALDIFSLDFPSEVLQVTLPILQERIVSPEWPVREAAILAFGAINYKIKKLELDRLLVGLYQDLLVGLLKKLMRVATILITFNLLSSQLLAVLWIRRKLFKKLLRLLYQLTLKNLIFH
ncbi:hypothetical protein QCA50_016836 [Cerrena zonata]|uniref:Uncharacterized protein n=1 Tax=Cerrena zonata TaxID=2478898 RepID=A0AAW0FH63_9APHY